MADGSRHFLSVPQRVLWYAFRDYLATQRGVIITGFVTDGIIGAWIDFSYEGHSFTINDQYGEYWFFVQDPACPEAILRDVAAHVERQPHPGGAQQDG